MDPRAWRWAPLIAGAVLLAGCGGSVESTPGGSESGGITSGGAPSGGVASGGAPSGGSTPVLPPREPEVHRAEARSCVGVHDPAEPNLDYASGDCRTHADCTEGEGGKCVNGQGSSYGYLYCVYDTCETDADCDPGMVCYCTESTAARCLSIGNCQTDADCAAGSYCSPSMSWDCGGYRPIDGFHCHTPGDTCIDDADCTGDDYCNFDVYDGR
ncbi:MAG TPA: hypothetical protein PLU22_25610 [Polyangiaceae bacterium]|nr:hypothetical protein [Polyangiaceae bacterium]